MNRPTSWSTFVRQYLSGPRTPAAFRSSPPQPSIRFDDPVSSISDGTSREITFRDALTLAMTCKETLDGIERLRGVKVPMSGVQLQVDRHPNNRSKRVFRLYGPPAEIKRVTARPVHCAAVWSPNDLIGELAA